MDNLRTMPTHELKAKCRRLIGDVQVYKEQEDLPRIRRSLSDLREVEAELADRRTVRRFRAGHILAWRLPEGING